MTDIIINELLVDYFDDIDIKVSTVKNIEKYGSYLIINMTNTDLDFLGSSWGRTGNDNVSLSINCFNATSKREAFKLARKASSAILDLQFNKNEVSRSRAFSLRELPQTRDKEYGYTFTAEVTYQINDNLGD